MRADVSQSVLRTAEGSRPCKCRFQPDIGKQIVKAAEQEARLTWNLFIAATGVENFIIFASHKNAIIGSGPHIGIRISRPPDQGAILPPLQIGEWFRNECVGALERDDLPRQNVAGFVSGSKENSLAFDAAAAIRHDDRAILCLLVP